MRLRLRAGAPGSLLLRRTDSFLLASEVRMIYSFDSFVLDTRRCELRSGEEQLHLEPQVYAVLCHLIENRERVVRKEELLDAVWGHRFVTPATLNSRIKSLRQALCDDGSTQRIVRTVRGIGFRFTAQVRELGPGEHRPSGSPSVERSPPGDQQIRFCRGHGGIRLAYATCGFGPPLLKPANWLTHLEHDWNSPVWRHWLTELSRDRTLIRYDQRGSGLSDRDVEDVSFECWVGDMESLLDELGLERVAIIALSQGCPLAVVFAALHPERVSRLVLYGGYAQGRARRPSTPAERAQNEVIFRMLPLGWGHDNPAFRYFFANLFLPEGTSEQMGWFSELQRVSATAEMAVQLALASARIDVTEIAPKVRAPTLVLHAKNDAAVPFEQGRLMARLIPGARFVPLEGCNHVLLETEPAWPRFLAEVRRFLAEDDPVPVAAGGAAEPFGERQRAGLHKPSPYLLDRH